MFPFLGSFLGALFARDAAVAVVEEVQEKRRRAALRSLGIIGILILIFIGTRK